MIQTFELLFYFLFCSANVFTIWGSSFSSICWLCASDSDIDDNDDDVSCLRSFLTDISVSHIDNLLFAPTRALCILGMIP